VDIRFGHEVVAFDSDSDGVRTRVRRGGDQYVIESEYLCGCDGAHSAVREGLGMELEGKTYRAHAKLADVRIEDERDQLPWPRVDFAQPNLSAVVRFRPGYWRIIFAGPGENDGGAPTPEFIQSKVGELIGRGPAETAWASSFHIHCRNAPHFRVGRVVLLGDAAHLNSPAGGQGMNAGIHDAHNLAWKLALALSGGDPEVLLKSYDAERYDAVTRTVDVATDRLTRFGVLGAPWLRSMGLALIRWLSRFASVQRRMGVGLGMLGHRYDEGDLIHRSGGRLCPDIDLGDGLRLRDVLRQDGGLVEVVRNGMKVCVGEATYDLSAPAGKEIARVGGPWLAVRPDHVIAYSGGSREEADTFLALCRANPSHHS
jgi:2-polyprenyl-6-methoxyphenol hydroxylase-like FAD-dependent oxidoreductase